MFTTYCLSSMFYQFIQMIENLLSKMYIENAFISKSHNIALSFYPSLTNQTHLNVDTLQVVIQPKTQLDLWHAIWTSRQSRTKFPSLCHPICGFIHQQGQCQNTLISITLQSKKTNLALHYTIKAPFNQSKSL